MMKVLLVDDDEGSRRALRAQLMDIGYNVTSVDTGERAWELFQHEPFRMVISDWVMPGRIDGMELCRRIREHKGEYAYFLMVSGLMLERDSYLRAMDQGVDDFLGKPVDREDLWVRLRVAERMLGLRAHIRALQGTVSICSYCKRIKDQDGRYEDVDLFLQRNAAVTFSHGICPDCYAHNEFKTPGRQGPGPRPA